MQDPLKGRGDSKFTRGKKRLAMVIGLSVFYLEMLGLLGFVYATFLFALGLMKVFGVRGIARPCLIAAAVAVFSYVVFYEIFRVPLPRSRLF